MRQYRPDVERQNPVTTLGLIAQNLLDVLGGSEAGKLKLQFSQFKESLAHADLQAQYACAERLL